ncbi:MAG: prolyl oligopeptidase family serine peptidase [Pseudomonadota bacterium]
MQNVTSCTRFLSFRYFFVFWSGILFIASCTDNSDSTPLLNTFSLNDVDSDRLAKVSAANAGALSFPGIQINNVRWLDNDHVLIAVSDKSGRTWKLFDTSEGSFISTITDQQIANTLNLSDKKLPDERHISSFSFSTDGMKFDFDLSGKHYLCTKEPMSCSQSGPALNTDRQWPLNVFVFGDMGPDVSSAPNDAFIALRNGPNVEIRSTKTGALVVKTSDGAENYSYGNTLPTAWSGRVQVEVAGLEPPVEGIWSADSRYFLTFLSDDRHTSDSILLQTQPGPDRRTLPKAIRYKNQLPTDEKSVQVKYVVLDTTTGQLIKIDMPWINAPIDPIRSRFVQWKNNSSDSFFFLSHSRGSREITLWEGSISSQNVRQVYREKSSTRAGVTGSFIQYGVEDIPDTPHYTWYSDKDGRGQYYRLNGETGDILNQISSDNVTVKDIQALDGKESLLYYTAYPDPSDTDPDRLQLYVAHLESGEQKRLTEFDFHHELVFSPDAKRYANISSRIDVPPILSVHTAPTSIENSDETVTKILIESSAEGWALPPKSRPSRFQVMAADGVTPLFGNMLRPSDWSENEQYPIINWVYGSAEYAVAQEGFAEDSLLQKIADGGFIVIRMDSRGTPGRTKAFNDFGIGAEHNRCGVEDHVAAVKQLADRDPTIDASRAAAGGWSGGGQCAYRFALHSDDFFKAALIGAPSTDPFILGTLYIEDFLGLYSEVPQLYAEGADDPMLKNLKADLFFIHGELDEDVHPAATMRIVDQLIKHDKNFELLLVPGESHILTNRSYLALRIADFYSRSLKGRSLFKNSISTIEE